MKNKVEELKKIQGLADRYLKKDKELASAIAVVIDIECRGDRKELVKFFSKRFPKAYRAAMAAFLPGKNKDSIETVRALTKGLRRRR